MSDTIVVSELVKTYNKSKKCAVDNISFTVQSGEFFALLGPNGAGKTTTISILTTTLSKTSGRIIVSGHDLDQDPNAVRKSIGVIFQKPSLDENLTAEENVRFHSVLYGLYPFRPTFKMMPKPYQDQLFNLAEVLGIQNDIFAPIKTFSGGMKRKLEIIRSLIHSPEVLFLDEPTSGLDPESRKKLWNYIKGVKKDRNTTIFLTTHYLEEAEEADTVAVINYGKIVVSGSPRELKKDLLSNKITVDSKDRKKLLAELKKKRIPFLIEDDGIEIPFHDITPHKIIREIQSDLSKLVVKQPTLEDAYIEIINSGKKND